MSAVFYTLVLVTQFTVIFAALPPIQKCKLTDSTCLKTSAQAAALFIIAGMSEIGTEPLDVMHIDSMKVDLAGLKMDINNADVTGLKKAVIAKVNVDLLKKRMDLAWDTDILLKGQYKASGRLLFLPISGDGDMTIKLKNLHIDMSIPFEVTKNEEGKDMLDLKGYKYKFEVKDNAHFALTNLFNGNKVLGDTMLNFINENWRILSQEFGGAMLEKPNKKIYDAIKAYLRLQPIENIIEY